MRLHDHTIFVIFALFLSFGLNGACSSRSSRSDDGEALFRTWLALFGRANVPDVRLERITSAADAHLGEVAHGILGLGKSCCHFVRTSGTQELWEPTYLFLLRV